MGVVRVLIGSLIYWGLLGSALAQSSCPQVFNGLQSRKFGLTGIYFEGRGIAHKTLTDVGTAVNTTRELKVSTSPPDDIGFIPTYADYDYEALSWHLAWGIESTHRSYGRRLSDNEKKVIAKFDWERFRSSLSSENFGYVSVTLNKETKGFLRVYSGTARGMPAELLLKEKNIQTSVFDRYRSQGYELFELGKYFLSSDLNPVEIKNVRAAIFKWLIKTYLNDKKVYAKRLYFIDVSSPVHARAYKAMFGAKEIDRKLFEPALDPVDSILFVDPMTLRDRLEKIINADTGEV